MKGREMVSEGSAKEGVEGWRRARTEKHVTRYEFNDAPDPRTPETGHTALLGKEEVVTLDTGGTWSGALDVARLEEDGRAPIVVDIDPLVDPMLLWAGKRSRREVAVLPLQRNEVVAESRIARLVDRVRERAAVAAEDAHPTLFGELEKELRESDKSKRIEFYTHDENWKNKLICGDSLAVMESLIRYEGLRGAVQMIYVDPPYGIKYDANFQQRVDTAKNDPRDRADDVVTIKAFRDTWVLGIHSYLSYLADRLYVARELLAESGSIFVQMNQENVHLVRNVLDEVFGRGNFIGMIIFTKTGGMSSRGLAGIYDCLLWYGKNAEVLRYRQIYEKKTYGGAGTSGYTLLEAPDGSWRSMTAKERDDVSAIPAGYRIFDGTPLVSDGEAKEGRQSFDFEGRVYMTPPGTHWKTTQQGLRRLAAQDRIVAIGKRIEYKRYYDDFPYLPLDNIWLGMGERGFVGSKLYAVQTDPRIVERCILMTTDPGDVVLDPTCGSGTTAYAAEKLGRRWVTCDTSRVAMNVARQRLLSSVYEHYRTRSGVLSGGFVYQTADRITLKSLAYGMEPERVELVDQPELDPSAVRVTGPFEVMTLGRYSVEDWKGYVTDDSGDGRLENYIEVISRLYRRDASLNPSGGMIHAVFDQGDDRPLGVSVGPISGRVTARQIYEAGQEAVAAGLGGVHILGWAFEANVNEVRTEVSEHAGVPIEVMMIRPDTLADGLKATRPESLFSPLCVPDIEVHGGGTEVWVGLHGVAVYDRKRQITEFKKADSGYVAAWYLDEDYDGDCFVDCQTFFDFKRKPAIERALDVQINPDEWTLRLVSDRFQTGRYRQIAVKVVDVFGNESTVIRELT